MHLDFMSVFSSLFNLFVLIAAGYLAVRRNILEQEWSRAFSAFLMHIALPCMVFTSLVTRPYHASFLKDGILIVVIGLFMFAGLQFLYTALSRLLRIPEGRRGIWAFSCTYCNNGFMGFPIILTLLGEDALALAVIMGLSYNLTVYTLGALSISSDSGDSGQRPDLKKVMLSSINFALLMSLIFYFGQIPVPSLVLKPLEYLGNTTTPLSMIIAGMALGKSRGTELFTDRDAWSATFVRLLVTPFLMLFLMRVLSPANPLIIPVVVITAAMPAPGTTMMLTEMYHGNMALASRIVFLTNLFCLLTIPLVCLFL